MTPWARGVARGCAQKLCFVRATLDAWCFSIGLYLIGERTLLTRILLNRRSIGFYSWVCPEVPLVIG